MIGKSQRIVETWVEFIWLISCIKSYSFCQTFMSLKVVVVIITTPQQNALDLQSNLIAPNKDCRSRVQMLNATLDRTTYDKHLHFQHCTPKGIAYNGSYFNRWDVYLQDLYGNFCKCFCRSNTLHVTHRSGNTPKRTIRHRWSFLTTSTSLGLFGLFCLFFFLRVLNFLGWSISLRTLRRRWHVLTLFGNLLEELLSGPAAETVLNVANSRRNIIIIGK